MENRSQKIFNLPEYWKIIRKRKMVIILPIITVLITVYIGSFFMKPVYEASTTLMIKDERLLNQSIAPIIPGMTVQPRAAKIIKIKILRRENLVALIDSLKFKEDEELQLFARQEQTKYPGLSIDEILESMLLENLISHIMVEPIGQEFIKIAAHHHKAKIACRMASLLSEIFLASSLNTQLGSIKGAIQFGTEQVEKYREKLEKSEEKLRRYRQGVVSAELNNHQLISSNLNQLNSMLVSTNHEITETKDKYQSLNLKCSRQTNSVQIPMNSFLETSISRLYTRSAELPALLLKLDWKAPEVILLKNELLELKAGIGRELRRLSSKMITDENQLNYFVSKKLVKTELDVLNRNRNLLQSNLAKFKKNVAADPERDMKIARLQEEVTMNRELYNMVLQQKNGSQIQESLKRTEAALQFEIIEPAVIPLKPIKPQKFKLMLMGGMLGFIIGIAIVFLLEYNDDSFKDKEELEEYLGLIVLGTIPLIRMKNEIRNWQRLLKPKFVVPIVMMSGGLICFIIMMLR